MIKDLPFKIKRKFIQELASLEYYLMDDKPIGSGTFECLCKTKKVHGGADVTFKVIITPCTLYEEEEKALKKSISEEESIR